MSDQLHLCSVIECDTLACNCWIGSFRINCRYYYNDLGSSVGCVTCLRPVGVSAFIDASVPVLELLAFLEFSDCGGVLDHESILRAPGGQLKVKVKELLEASPSYLPGALSGFVWVSVTLKEKCYRGMRAKATMLITTTAEAAKRK